MGPRWGDSFFKTRGVATGSGITGETAVGYVVGSVTWDPPVCFVAAGNERTPATARATMVDTSDEYVMPSEWSPL